MKLTEIYTFFESAAHKLSEDAPDILRHTADTIHEIEEGLRKSADVIENWSPLVGAANEQEANKHAAAKQECDEVESHLCDLQEECQKIASGTPKFKAGQTTPTTNALPPELQQLLAQMIVQGIQAVLKRLRERRNKE
jgi:uncharacterized membrane protein YccC